MGHDLLACVSDSDESGGVDLCARVSDSDESGGVDLSAIVSDDDESLPPTQDNSLKKRTPADHNVSNNLSKKSTQADHNVSKKGKPLKSLAHGKCGRGRHGGVTERRLIAHLMVKGRIRKVSISRYSLYVLDYSLFIKIYSCVSLYVARQSRP